MPRSISLRSNVGATSALTTPLNEIRPTSTSGSTSSTKSRAACCAASKRSGSTSVAIIESDTSNRTRMRPWLRSRSVVRSTGRAMATMPIASPASCSTATRCRRQPGRCGAISSSRSTWVNRTWAARRQRSTTTYATARRGIASRSHSRPGSRKSVVIGAACPRGRPAGAGDGRGRRSHRASRRRSTARSAHIRRAAGRCVVRRCVSTRARRSGAEQRP